MISPGVPLTAADELLLLRAAMAQTHDAVVITEAAPLDPPGPRIVYANAAFTRLTGYAASEVLGRSPRMLQGPGTSRAALRALRDAMARVEPVTVELVNYRKDGTEYRVQSAVTPVADASGRVTHFVSVQRDLTARTRGDDALREGEARFRRVFDEGPLGMALLDADERFETVNARLCALLGRAPSELVGVSLGEVTHPEDRDLHARGMLAMRRGDAPSCTVERRAARPDGAVQWLRMTAAPLRSASGVEGTLAMFEHTTGQREGTLALAEARDRAESAARARGQFLASVTHELRTPLNAVIGFAQVLLKETAGPLSARQRGFTQHILDSGQHMLRLVNDLLDLRRAEEARQAVTLAAMDLAPQAERALAMLRPTCEARHIALVSELPAGLPRVRADADAVVQVLANLLSNAVGFTRDDGEGRVVLRARDEGPRVRVEVEDNGAGIAPEDHARIFDWFEQGASPPPRARKGTGIGLALTRALVRRMGGEVSLSSALGAGATFSFTLIAEEGP
ncbi:MAG: PAS domain S-box protein [Polyangiales bacterium]